MSLQETTLDTEVIVIGTGPVGMVLAMELKSRGVDVISIEKRTAAERAADLTMARCNTNASRTMEILRRLGVADKIRAVGLPDDYPTDVVWHSRGNGHELARLRLPSRAQQPFEHRSLVADWPSAEPVHRASQLLVDPVLFEHLKGHWQVDVREGLEYVGFEDKGDHVRVSLRPSDGGEEQFLTCRYLVGCDGGRSLVRKQAGIGLSGDDELYRSRTLYLRAPWMLDHLKTPVAWMNNFVGPGPIGFMIAIDGREHWLLHIYLPGGETDFGVLDTDRDVRAILSLPPEREFEILNKEDWIARRLVAEDLRRGNVFICGDAAHLWPPFGGHGMNAGVADANNLACHLASVLRGWADEAVLDCHVAERHPVLDQVSRFAMDKVMAFKKRNTARTYHPAIEDDSEEGEAERAAEGERLLAVHAPQYGTKGLNYACFYDQSPIIAYDGEDPPLYDMGSYTPSTVPGCRAPHFFTLSGESIYDLIGDGYALLRFDETIPVDKLVEAAERRGMPLRVLDLRWPDEPAYRHPLTLVRPDHQVAWRGMSLPQDPLQLVDLVRGALINKGGWNAEAAA